MMKEICSLFFRFFYSSGSGKKKEKKKSVKCCLSPLCPRSR